SSLPGVGSGSVLPRPSSPSPPRPVPAPGPPGCPPPFSTPASIPRSSWSSFTTKDGRWNRPTSRSRRPCWAAASCAPAPCPASPQEIYALLTACQAIRIAIADATATAPGADPDGASFSAALQAARDQVIQAANVIASETTDLAGAIGRAVLDPPMPRRRLRVSPRAVKRPMSRYAYKRLRVDRRTYKATISIDILTAAGAPRLH